MGGGISSGPGAEGELKGGTRLVKSSPVLLGQGAGHQPPEGVACSDAPDLPVAFAERREPRERREKRAPVADNVCAPNGTALETAAPADGAALDTDLDTYFDGAKEEAAPAAGDDVMAA